MIEEKDRMAMSVAINEAAADEAKKLFVAMLLDIGSEYTSPDQSSIEKFRQGIQVICNARALAMKVLFDMQK